MATRSPPALYIKLSLLHVTHYIYQALSLSLSPPCYTLYLSISLSFSLSLCIVLSLSLSLSLSLPDPSAIITTTSGGPGGSGTGYGNFMEIGPLDNNKIPRNHTWLKEASLIFIDSPVGAG